MRFLFRIKEWYKRNWSEPELPQFVPAFYSEQERTERARKFKEKARRGT